jgi:hypothetical protein
MHCLPLRVVALRLLFGTTNLGTTDEARFSERTERRSYSYTLVASGYEKAAVMQGHSSSHYSVF